MTDQSEIDQAMLIVKFNAACELAKERSRRERAERALVRAGWTCAEGTEEWLRTADPDAETWNALIEAKERAEAEIERLRGAAQGSQDPETAYALAFGDICDELKCDRDLNAVLHAIRSRGPAYSAPQSMNAGNRRDAAERTHFVPIDLKDATLEEALWRATPRLRWYRPRHGNDNDIILQQMYERVTGEHDWRTVETLLED